MSCVQRVRVSMKSSLYSCCTLNLHLCGHLDNTNNVSISPKAGYHANKLYMVTHTCVSCHYFILERCIKECILLKILSNILGYYAINRLGIVVQVTSLEYCSAPLVQQWCRIPQKNLLQVTKTFTCSKSPAYIMTKCLNY